MKRTLWLLFFLSLWAPLSAFGEGDHRVLVRYSGPSPAKYVPSLVASLSGDRLSLRTVVSDLPADAPQDSVVKEAQRYACDIILRVTIEDASGRDQLLWSLDSPAEDIPRASGTLVKPRPDWSAAAELYWIFLTGPVAKAVAADAKPWPQALVSEQTPFTVKARPGTQVTGFPQGPVVVDDSGEVAVTLNLPVSVYLEGHLVGWGTKPVRVYVDGRDQSVSLDQSALPQWGLTVSLNNFAFPSIGGLWVPSGGRLAIRGQLDQYLGGLSLSARTNVGAQSWPVQSVPLLAFQGGASWNWSWPEDQIQFYTALDLGLRFMFPQFKGFWLEPVAPLTIQPLAGWDYQWTQGHSLYFEIGPTLVWVSDEAAYLSSLRSNQSSLQIKLLGPFYASLPVQAKAGYRWSF